MRRQHLENGTCRVTFELAAQAGVEAAHLCGEFNGWSTSSAPSHPPVGHRLGAQRRPPPAAT